MRPWRGGWSGRRRASAQRWRCARKRARRPDSAATADRLAGRLLHLRGGGSLAGQQRQRRPATRDGTDRAAYNCAAVVCSYDGCARLRPRARSTAATARTSPRSRAPRSRSTHKINVACSGATTANIFRASQGGQDGKGESTAGRSAGRRTRSVWNVKLVVLVDRRQRPRLRGHRAGLRDRVPEPDQGPCRTSPAAGAQSTVPTRRCSKRGRRRSTRVRAVMSAAGYQNFQFVLQTYPVGVRAGEREPIPRERRRPRAGVGGCPSYDADADWARDSVVSQISNGLRFVAAVKHVQLLDLRDASRGVRSARRRRGRRRSTSRRRRRRASGGGC